MFLTLKIVPEEFDLIQEAAGERFNLHVRRYLDWGLQTTAPPRLLQVGRLQKTLPVVRKILKQSASGQQYEHRRPCRGGLTHYPMNASFNLDLRKADVHSPRAYHTNPPRPQRESETLSRF